MAVDMDRHYRYDQTWKRGLGICSHEKLISPHTVLNKITGLLLFLLPVTLSFVDLTYTLPIVCTVATVAAMHEWFYMEKKHDT